MTGISRGILGSLVLFVPLSLAACDDGGRVVTDESQLAASLPGSDFEIDDDANLVDDASNPLETDWLDIWTDDGFSYTEDTASGQTDNSYKGGSKENDVCPATSTGSIPNNKSDLKHFGVYQEAGDPGFMHLFWSRVQDPSGTTLMDFEFNQSEEECGNGVNRVRMEGDLLLEYRLEQGGATASIKARRWNGSEWGDEEDLTAINAATGTINSSAIAEGGELGALDPRTFGEASIDLDYVFDEGSCTSFGSAFVKSRSSDSFNSALKDFIGPIPVDITNCGKVIVRKETDPADLGTSFDFSSDDLATDPPQDTSFSLADGESQEFTNVLFGDYTITEADYSPGIELTDIDCSASVGVNVAMNTDTRSITFTIDDDADIVDCTFFNQAKGTLVVRKLSTDGVGTFSFSSPDAEIGDFDLTTTSAGVAVQTSFANLDPDTYSVAETVPPGWHLIGSSCDNGDVPSAVAVGAGDTVICTFTNERLRGAIRIVKTRNHAQPSPGVYPHAGVEFTIVEPGGLGHTVLTDASGVACLDGLLLSAYIDGGGTYTVTESVPSGYSVAPSVSQNVLVTQVATCPGGDEVLFHNTPLTNVTVSVDSQVDGGTTSTVLCDGLGSVQTAPNGDGSWTLSNLAPGSYNCSITIQ